MWAIGIHGGAGAAATASEQAEERALDAALAWAERELARGASALDVAQGAIRLLEDSGAFVAGKGSSPNSAGDWELDASLCDGATRRCGAIAALRGAYPPIAIARAVMERTRHVLIAGEGALAFARECGFTLIDAPAAFFAPVRRASAAGTVGAVVLDAAGRIAAGTSTGGTFGKRPGRVGDSPIVGAGSWADAEVGVSCTGEGEYFIRVAAAHAVALRRREMSLTLDDALGRTLAEIAELGGKGGIIAVDRSGTLARAFNSEAMRLATAHSDGTRRVVVARSVPQNRS